MVLVVLCSVTKPKTPLFAPLPSSHIEIHRSKMDQAAAQTRLASVIAPAYLNDATVYDLNLTQNALP